LPKMTVSLKFRARLAGLALAAALSSPAAAQDASGAQSASPGYKPPTRGAPTDRIGAGTRRMDDVDGSARDEPEVRPQGDDQRMRSERERQRAAEAAAKAAAEAARAAKEKEVEKGAPPP
jgi:hypothetical protein